MAMGFHGEWQTRNDSLTIRISRMAKTTNSADFLTPFLFSFFFLLNLQDICFERVSVLLGFIKPILHSVGETLRLISRPANRVQNGEFPRYKSGDNFLCRNVDVFFSTFANFIDFCRSFFGTSSRRFAVCQWGKKNLKTPLGIPHLDPMHV